MNRGRLEKCLGFAWAYARFPFVSRLHSDRTLLERHQRSALANILRYSLREVPHYRQYARGVNIDEIAEANSFKVLMGLPSLSKETVRQRLGTLIPNEVPPSVRGRTSGSTNEPMLFIKPKSLRYKLATCLMLEKVRCGRALWGERVAVVTPLSPERLVKNDEYNSSFFQTKRSVAHGLYYKRGVYYKDLDSLEEFGPTTIESTPTGINALMEYAKMHGRMIQADYIVCQSEVLSDSDKLRFREFFDARSVVNRYGLFELGDVASSCSEGEGLHINSDLYIVETLDGRGQPVVGEAGTIHITSLANYSMPLVRYNTGDIGTLMMGRCRCGSALPRLCALQGREADMLAAADGEQISPACLFSYFGERFPAFKQACVKQYQIVQKANGDIVFRYTPVDSTFDLSYIDQFRALASDFFGGERKISMERVSSFRVESSGKFLPIVRESDGSGE